MERKNLIRAIAALGWSFSREGKKHEIWSHPTAISTLSVPRGKILNPGLARWLCVLARRYPNEGALRLAA